MTSKTPVPWTWALAALVMAAVAFAQPPATPAPPAPTAPPAAPAPPAPPSPVSGIRNKLSAGDLLSAESILEVHRQKSGEDSTFLVGLSWLARGALLLGNAEKARSYAADVRARCAERITKLDSDPAAATAIGAVIEVEAQLLDRSKGAKAAAEFVRGELARLKGPPSFQSRLSKRINMLTLTGSVAPELVVEDWIGERPPTLASLRGKPVLLFIWAESCGDCRAQAAGVARIKKRHAEDGLQVLALTRYYDDPPERIAEKARVDSVWKTFYADVGTVPIVFSTASMERYGGSSTPTFVFVDRKGMVRGYTPTRLTEGEFDRALAGIVK